MSTYTWNDVGDWNNKILTQEEKQIIADEWNAWEQTAPTRALAVLREKRTRLLAETDFYALSDVTLSDDMTTYRQALRDLPSGKDTVSKCENATWPTKP